jgi:hypothetical protein
VEAREIEAASVQILIDQRRDQAAADQEVGIDAPEFARDRTDTGTGTGTGMAKDDREHGDRPEAVDLCRVPVRSGAFGCFEALEVVGREISRNGRR